ncbi:alpha/beta fold hydrolase [Haloechinothrix alba]|uniref:alpha/beta fold hydrolase n=1 Tax=Haloechinothrix alba TaxID=664784 RepID=UPI001FEC7018|nr:alpha/beta fold hydrolase [Haloechinothrix alba]
MLRSTRSRKAVPRAVAAVVVILGAASAFLLLGGDEQPAVHTQEAIVDVPRSPDSVEKIALDVTLYEPRSTPAPAVLVPHGFGGSKDNVQREATELAEHGFVALAYSARGFGESGGTISLNDPDREVADAAHLIDFAARQPSVITDSDGDPVLAVTGSSYGGALALLLAGTDDRVDAIAPVMTYHDLEHALLPNARTRGRHGTDTPAHGAERGDGVFKQAWAGALFTGGRGGISTPGREAPEPGDRPDSDADRNGAPTGRDREQPPSTLPENAGLDGPCGRFAADVCRAYTGLATTGTADDQARELLERASPASVADDITIPTLLVQGTQDTLFGLGQAEANARRITEAGGDVSVIWYAGGHDGGAPGPQLREKIADWLSYQLTGDGDPLPAFSYDVRGNFDATRAPSVRTVEVDEYPGLRDDSTPRREIELTGPEQTVTHPPGGVPAAISSMPALSGPVASALGGTDLPGQFARFSSHTLDDQLLITGSSTVTFEVAAATEATELPSTQPGIDDAEQPEQPGSDPRAGQDAVLFAKLYDVGPDGTRRLPGGAVAPVRVPDLPPDGSAVTVTVSLPGIVHPVEPGHRLQLVVATTDQAYAPSTEPAAYRVSLTGAGGVSVPSVPGTETGTELPVAQLWGIAGLLLAAALVAAFAALRRAGTNDVAEDLAEVPLAIDGLTKTYPGGLTAVSELSFRVERGQVLGLLGPNGAGKTTALRMLMGLVTPTSGEIRVFGHRVYPGAPVLSRVGSFVEGPGFMPHLSGRKNLELFWAATGRPRGQAHVAEALEIAGLGDAVDRKVRTYSQGMRQRLAIAQAMLGLPDVLVLDEPTNGLDPPQIHQMREVLRRYADTGRTVLVSSHLLAEVEQTSTHVVVMHHGTVVADGAVGEIVAAGGEATFVVDDPGTAAETLRRVEGLTGIEVDGETVHADLHGIPRSVAVTALVHAGVSVERAGPRRRLEDAFLQLVGEEGDTR